VRVDGLGEDHRQGLPGEGGLLIGPGLHLLGQVEEALDLVRLKSVMARKSRLAMAFLRGGQNDRWTCGFYLCWGRETSGDGAAKSPLVLQERPKNSGE